MRRQNVAAGENRVSTSHQHVGSVCFVIDAAMEKLGVAYKKSTADLSKP
jgi:hypothetical protein